MHRLITLFDNAIVDAGFCTQGVAGCFSYVSVAWLSMGLKGTYVLETLAYDSIG